MNADTVTWQDRADALRAKREGEGRLSFPDSMPMQGTSGGVRDTIRAPFGEAYFPAPDTLAIPAVILPPFPEDDDYRAPVIDAEGVRWHYVGKDHRYGVTADGLDVEQKLSTGEVKRILSVNQRREIVAVATSGPRGVALAARKFGVPVTTVRSWIKSGDYL